MGLTSQSFIKNKVKKTQVAKRVIKNISTAFISKSKGGRK